MILLAEGFDPYFVAADMTTAGWSTFIVATLGNASHTPFIQGQSGTFTSSSSGTYPSWGSNETTVYGSLWLQTFNTSSSTTYNYLSFTDTGTAQVTIRWNMDGSIGLYTGGPTGTLISTTTSVFVGGTSGTWNSFQFKIVINNTTGSIELRVNGVSTNTITATNVNTRGGTSNAYVNGFILGASPSGGAYIDNLFLNNTSGNAPTSWPGEMRALQQYPTTVVSPNFSVFPTTTSFLTTINTASVLNQTANTTYYCPFSAPTSGTVASLTFLMNANLTGNVKFAIYDSTGPSGAPGTVLATSNAVNNPTTAGPNTATFSSPPTLVGHVTYFCASVQDATANMKGALESGVYTSATSYASFPVNSPTFASGPVTTNTIGETLIFSNNNAAGVQELIEDGDTTYIYTSSNVEDKYNMSAAVASTYTVSAVQYYAMWKKTDVGYRTASLSVAANGSADTNLVTVTPTMTYAYAIKTLELDPTGAAWTPTTANGAILGVTAG